MRLVFVLFAAFAGGAGAAGPAWMPVPARVQPAAGRLLVDSGFGLDIPAGSDARLADAGARLLARISRQIGIRFTPVAAGASAHSLRVECAGSASYPALGQDESYALDVSESGASLKAATVEGILHGLETFAQAIQPGPDGFQVSAVHIEDKPRFPWRGLMLDACRHWMPMDVVKRNLDAMAAVKLNAFHWHLSDDQAFRVESKRYPRLHQMGSNGDFYSQDQIREIVEYARRRGIRVVPEFDIPGHTTAWFAGYPELAAAPGPYKVETRFGVFDPAMDPGRDAVYEFLDGFIGEIAPLFPDAFWHVGGDEVNGRQWRASASLQAFAKEHGLADDRAIQAYFNQRVGKILEKYGRRMIGWDEILSPGLPATAVIQSWRGQKSLAQAAAQGYSGILSSGYYLDHLRPAEFHYGVDPLGAEAADLSADQAALILGGEACMWAELADAETVDSRIWPRAAVVAERLWSPSELKDVDSMYDRMEAVSRMLEWTGVRHRANYQPMLDRLSGNRPAPPLRVLADACEARGLGQGRSAGRSTTSTPLNRFVDAVRPESESVRTLEQAARRFIANPSAAQADLAQMREQFAVWAANDNRFQALAENNALLEEVKPLSKDLSALGTAGLKMLEYISKNKRAPRDWLARQMTELTRLRRPIAETQLAAARPVRLLADELTRRANR